MAHFWCLDFIARMNLPKTFIRGSQTYQVWVIPFPVYYKTKRWVWALGLFQFSTKTLYPAFNEFITNNDEQIIVIDRDKKIKADVIFYIWSVIEWPGVLWSWMFHLSLVLFVFIINGRWWSSLINLVQKPQCSKVGL